MIEEFKNFLENESLSENTCQSYIRDVEIFIKYYEEKYGEKLTTLEHPDITTYINDMLKAEHTATTINRKLSALKKYNEYLINQKIQNDIVIREKDYIKIQSNIIQEELPEPKEIARIKHDIYKNSKNSKRDYCFFILLMYGGFRASEMVSIRIKDVHLEEHWITIIGKGNKFRQVIINNEMYDALEEYLKETNNGGERLNRNFCNRLLNKYKDFCKGTNLHPHLMRAFFCSNALHNAGYTIDQVANQAGHSSLNTTNKYLRTKKEDLLTLANRK